LDSGFGHGAAYPVAVTTLGDVNHRSVGRPATASHRYFERPSISRVFTPQSRRVQSRPQFVAQRIFPNPSDIVAGAMLCLLR